MPAAFSAALLVVCFLYRFAVGPALKVALQPNTSTQKSWQHFRLVTAYVAVCLIAALLVGLLVIWAQALSK
ncbi:MAG TPA: hypothetical protein VI653_09715 [Steroidobacteraceae bacterium]